MALSIQLFVNGKWHDAADIQFSDLALDGAVTLAYNFRDDGLLKQINQ